MSMQTLIRFIVNLYFFCWYIKRKNDRDEICSLLFAVLSMTEKQYSIVIKCLLSFTKFGKDYYAEFERELFGNKDICCMYICMCVTDNKYFTNWDEIAIHFFYKHKYKTNGKVSIINYLQYGKLKHFYQYIYFYITRKPRNVRTIAIHHYFRPCVSHMDRKIRHTRFKLSGVISWSSATRFEIEILTNKSYFSYFIYKYI